jgi:hypothetical protein
MIRHEQNRTSTLENAEFLPSLDGKSEIFLREGMDTAATPRELDLPDGQFTNEEP